MQHYELDYMLTREDLLAFYRYEDDYFPNGRRRRQKSFSVCFFLAVLILAPAAFSFKDPSDAVLMLSLPAIGIALVIRYIYRNHVKDFFLRRFVQRYSQDLRSWLGRHNLTITPQSLTDKSHLVTSTWRWEAIEWIIRTDSHVFLMVKSGGAYIVPKTAFDDANEFEQFIEMVHKFRSPPATAITDKVLGSC